MSLKRCYILAIVLMMTVFLALGRPGEAQGPGQGEFFPFKIRWDMSPEEVTSASWEPLEGRASPVLTIYLYPMERNDLRGTFMCAYYGQDRKLASVDFQFPFNLQGPGQSAKMFNLIKAALNGYFVAEAVYEGDLKEGHKAAVWRDTDTFAVLSQIEDQAEVSVRFMDVADPNNRSLMDYWEEKINDQSASSTATLEN